MNTRLHINGRVQSLAAAALRGVLLVLCSHTLPCHATTAAETALRQAPMPHQSLRAGGAMARVHFASLHGFLNGTSGDAAQLAELHAQVRDCVRSRSAAGLPSRPPQAWPEHATSMRSDTYAAANRTIHYSAVLDYAVNPLDCSLLETQIHTATLFSRNGECNVDLRAQTAHGNCDATGHASAPSPVRRPFPSAAEIAAINTAAATNPAMAALAKAIAQHPPVGTGESKTIAGLVCDVWPHPQDPDGKQCMSRGGSFTAFNVTGDLKQSGMVLETTSKRGIDMVATRAELDASVSADVFVPYRAGGFRILGKESRP